MRYFMATYKRKWWVMLLRPFLPNEVRVSVVSRKEVKKPMYVRVGRVYVMQTKEVRFADSGDHRFLNLQVVNDPTLLCKAMDVKRQREQIDELIPSI